MSTIGRLLRNVRRLGCSSVRQQSRHRSTLTKARMIEGSNGERIITSPYGEISYPHVYLQDYIWQNFNNYADKIALECGVTGRKYNYAEARDACNFVARSLTNLGLKEGDVVALVTPNLPETPIAFLGILEAGLVVTTVNPIYTVDEISKQLKSSGAKAVIASKDVIGTVAAAARASLPPGSPIIVIEDGTGNAAPDNTIPFKDLITRGKSLPDVPYLRNSPDDTAVLPYSSGTTGMPKGVMLTHLNLISNIAMTTHSIGSDVIHPTTADFQEIVPSVLPFFHIFGMSSIMLMQLSVGGKLITIPRFIPETFLSVLENHKATMLYCVPPIVLFLSISPHVKKHHLQHLHSGFSGAAPLAKADVERLYEKLGIDETTFRFCQGYGMTESSPVTHIEKSGRKFASIGKPLSNCEACLVDPTTQENVCNPNQSGELWVRGPHVMKGYLNNPTATNEVLSEDGWLKTGDIAFFDEEFDFFITDRLKELIKVKGFQVAPAELEALLRTHPSVEEAAVIGIPDERCGEVPKAFVLPKKGKKLSEDEIKNFVKGKVSEFKELKGGVMFVDSIPKNASGKILRIQLKNQ